MTRASIIASILLAACTPARGATPTNIVVGTSSAAPLAVEDAPRPSARCPVVPLRLVLASPAAPQELTMLTLAADGEVRSVMLAADATAMGHLDDKGCLRMKSKVAVDASTPAVVWSPFAEHALDGKRMRLERRSLEIDAQGRVLFFDANGSPESADHGRFRLEGFTPAATCAARALLVLFFASMPSMAFSDGNPRTLPPPPGSKCNSYP